MSSREMSEADAVRSGPPAPNPEPLAPGLRDTCIAALVGARTGYPSWAHEVSRDVAVDRSADPIVQYLGGVLADELGEERLAITRLRRAIYLDRDLLPAYLVLSGVHRRAEDAERAEQAWSQVKRLVLSPAGRRHDDWIQHAGPGEIERFRQALVDDRAHGRARRDHP